MPEKELGTLLEVSVEFASARTPFSIRLRVFGVCDGTHLGRSLWKYENRISTYLKMTMDVISRCGLAI